MGHEMTQCPKCKFIMVIPPGTLDCPRCYENIPCPSCAALLADKRRLSDTVAAQVAEMAELRSRVALLLDVAEAGQKLRAALMELHKQEVIDILDRIEENTR